jgi:hypothetical protein
MKIQRIYYKLLRIAIHSVMLILLFACGKPKSENKNHHSGNHHSDEVRTVLDEEMEILTNAAPKIEKRILSKTKVLSIRIYPKNVLNPIEELDRVRLANCGRGNWDRNEVYYDKTKASWKNYTQSLVLVAKTDLHFKASSPNGGSINASLDELLKSNGASVSTKPNFIEIKLPSKSWPTALGKDELDIVLSLTPSKKAINIGNMREVRRICTRTPSEPTRGADGGRAGGWHKEMGQDFPEKENLGSFGYSAQVFEVQYDLEVYFISQY